jgi:hypothetical protein
MGAWIPVQVTGELAAHRLAVAGDAVDELRHHDVPARAAADRVASDVGLSCEVVRARTANQTVAAGAADKEVGASSPGQEIVAAEALQDVGALSAAKPVRAWAPGAHGG